MIDSYPSELRFTQIGLNTIDMPGTLRLYSELFGFAYSGAQPGWGKLLRIQGLDETARTLMTWMIGRQDFVQLEIFQHTSPQPALLPPHWTPAQPGWSRIGMLSVDFDATLAALDAWNCPLLGAVVETRAGRRAAFRDPFVGVVIEIIEETPDTPGSPRPRHFPYDAAIAYVARTVVDLEEARNLYGTVLGQTILPLDVLHDPADEAMWGLAGEARDGFLVKVGDAYIEVVRYENSRSAPSAVRRICDQGVMNVGLGSQDRDAVRWAISRIHEAGKGPEVEIVGGGLLATYILDPDIELELLSIPAPMQAGLGYQPRAPFAFEMQESRPGAA